MNGWFHSPYAPQVNMVSERFRVSSLAAAFAMPFRMATLDRGLYSETFAPDIRFAALVAVALALAAASLARGREGRRLQATDWRLLGFLAAASVLWLTTSANARYGMLVLLLGGVALARLVERLLPVVSARIALAAILIVQIGMLAFASPARWFIAEPWSKRWLPYDAPAEALREPALYLTVELLPMAVVAPFVHPDSSFVNLRGQHSVASDSPKLARLLETHRGHVRALGRGLALGDGVPPRDEVERYDASLRRIGYRLDTRDCFIIAWRPDDRDALSRVANRLTDASPSPEPLSVGSCRLVPAARDPADAEAERRASQLFDSIETRCPRLFRGQKAVTEPLGDGWSRNYGGLDARLELHGERVLLNRYRHMVPVDLGSASQWQAANGPMPGACIAPD
jgi:hypothetical protein